MIRKAVKEDLHTICEIMSASIDHPWNTQNILSAFLNKNNVFLVYEEDEILGYMIYSIIDTEAELESIAVRKEYRNRKIASALVKEIDAKTIFLEVRISNISAISFYKKMGFSEIAIRKNYYSQPAEDAIIMKKGE